MTAEAKRRILRIAVFQNGKLVEERLIRKRENVTIGPAARNTFILPTNRLSRSFTLFEVQGGQYHLNFNKQVEGRISIDDEVLDLQPLAKSGRAHRKGTHFSLPLGESARGRLETGDIKILFQFVDAPPVLPKTQLPAAARGGVMNRIDWTFTYILVLCALLLGGGGVGSDIWWRMEGRYLQEQYGSRRVKAYEVLKAEVLREKKEQPPPEEQPEEKTEELPTDVAAEGPAEEKPEDKPKKVAKKRKRAGGGGAPGKRKSMSGKALRASVRKKTFLNVLGSNDGTGGGSVADTLAKGIASSKLDSAFDGVGVDFAKGGDGSGTFMGTPKAVKAGGPGGRYKTLGAGDTTGRIATKAKVKRTKESGGGERKVRVNVRSGSLSGQSGIGKIDKTSVARVFRRRKGAIKYCYERALKTNPKIKGKVSVRFTIGSAGRITSIKVTSNTTGDPSVGSCIQAKIKSWRFPPAEGGKVTFTHTFVLSSS